MGHIERDHGLQVGHAWCVCSDTLTQFSKAVGFTYLPTVYEADSICSTPWYHLVRPVLHFSRLLGVWCYHCFNVYFLDDEIKYLSLCLLTVWVSSFGKCPKSFTYFSIKLAFTY